MALIGPFIEGLQGDIKNMHLEMKLQRKTAFQRAFTYMPYIDVST